MKPLYYLEFAKSVDENHNPIPAKSLKWKIRYPKVAWEDVVRCDMERITVQQLSSKHILRVAQAGWLHNIFIRVSTWFSDDWVIFKE